jgi:methylenetetrahydrofolate dehydrogenase (NADP+)/methenyltetrahydrofolate cyclohydrolase
MATILDGKELSKEIKQKLKMTIETELIAKGKSAPRLAVVLVGNNMASKVYVSGKIKACKEVGIISDTITLDENTTQEELNEKIKELNADKKINGILLQLPLPSHLNPNVAINLISPEKDVDGLTNINLGKLLSNDPSVIRSCTPLGVVTILQSYGIDIEGKNIAIINRSILVGKPLYLMLTQLNGTVTMCHTRTKDIKAVTLNSDIVISAVGVKNFITKDMIKPDAVVIDVGIVREEKSNKICGDVDFEEVSKVASYITPVPGGTGPMTITMLLKNTVNTTLSQNKR